MGKKKRTAVYVDKEAWVRFKNTYPSASARINKFIKEEVQDEPFEVEVVENEDIETIDLPEKGTPKGNVKSPPPKGETPPPIDDDSNDNRGKTRERGSKEDDEDSNSTPWYNREIF